ncbi:hypothetical protein EG240_04075 [Paenimyroides tangerinum]|uniref:Uncharacterized protein n=1 Tax=Paenimyroides tangerinum TaxID=2488728 RepID=A0A3P3WEA4_9FLAO|nr:hypothetical protein [Paenimyroides tangerinum]RRJ91969.1 hypothetical protein EG240_04075 [Paenimyroides tangerinum]
MKFNIEETQILIQILKYNLNNTSLIESNKEITYQTLLEKLENGEYIKGRLLNFLYIEIISSELKHEFLNERKLEEIVKKIKFKATPR